MERAGRITDIERCGDVIGDDDDKQEEEEEEEAEEDMLRKSPSGTNGGARSLEAWAPAPGRFPVLLLGTAGGNLFDTGEEKEEEEPEDNKDDARGDEEPIEEEDRQIIIFKEGLLTR